MKLITELNEEVKFLKEEKEGKQKYFIEGIFLQSSIPNKNKRIYPEHVMDKEAARYIQENINKNKAYGELGHPSGPTINLERSSHMIRSLVKEGKNYIGRAEILDTPMGNIVKSLLEAGANLGVSSRGLGSLKPISGGLNEVMDDFYLATAADIVADPSAPNAFVSGIMEGVEYFYENGILKEKQIHEIKQLVKKAPSKRLEEAKLIAFNKLMNFVSLNESLLPLFNKKTKTIGHHKDAYNGPLSNWRTHWLESFINDHVTYGPQSYQGRKFSKKEFNMVKDEYRRRHNNGSGNSGSWWRRDSDA